MQTMEESFWCRTSMVLSCLESGFSRSTSSLFDDNTTTNDHNQHLSTFPLQDAEAASLSPGHHWQPCSDGRFHYCGSLCPVLPFHLLCWNQDITRHFCSTGGIDISPVFPFNCFSSDARCSSSILQSWSVCLHEISASQGLIVNTQDSPDTFGHHCCYNSIHDSSIADQVESTIF